MPRHLQHHRFPRKVAAAGGSRLAVCAPNAFKGTLTASAAARALARGVRDAGWHAREVPVADGGDGTLDVLIAATGSSGRIQRVRVTGPLGRPRFARLGWPSPGIAVVEMAEAAGLRLLGARRDPLGATTLGVGELMLAALDGGAERVIVAVGGSASTDGGAGMLTALGARLTDDSGRDLPHGGGSLVRSASVDLEGLDPRLAHCRIEVAVDVFSELLGPGGAARVYAPQKGADAAEVALLEEGLLVFASVAERAAGRPGSAVLPGAGAGGGTGFALALLGAHLAGGAALVCDQVQLDAALDGADLVITGEGRLDTQTAAGKAPAEVAARAATRQVPCIAVCGEVSGGEALFHSTIALSELGAEPLSHGRALLRRAGALAAGSGASGSRHT